MELHNRLKQMDPGKFEELAGTLLTRLGFEDVQVTNISGDGGIDVIAHLVVAGVVRTRMAVQVKRYAKNVQRPEVQKVRGSLGVHDQGLIITTGGFSSGAREEANKPNAVVVSLMDGHLLVDQLIAHEIGSRNRQ
ncbi:MAG: restriction endonuclease [Chloroflexota bacterium]|nr:restriction endonuclease [Chloroflexota bacterium]